MNRQRTGFSIVEVILAVALFGLITVGLIGALLFGQESSFLTSQRSRALALAEEGLEAVRNIQEQSFAKIGSLPDGAYYLENDGAWWGLNDDTPELVDVFHREIFVTTIDGSTKEVTARISWQQNNKRTGLVELVTRFTNWAVRSWSQSTVAEFAAGLRNSLVINDQIADGALELDIEGNWNNPSVYISVDVPGVTDAEAIFMQDNTLWIGKTDQNLYQYDLGNVSDVAAPVLIGQFPIGAAPTGVYVYENYAYISSAADASEVVIIDLSGINPNISVDLPGTENATDIAIVDDKIVVTREDSAGAEILVYDLLGSVLIGTVEVNDTAYQLVGEGNYAYVATGNSTELAIVDVADCVGGTGTDCVTTWYDLASGGQIDATAIYYENGELYVGRASNQFHGLTVSGDTVLGEFLDYDSQNDLVRDIVVDTDAGWLYAVTDDVGDRELRIIDITNPASPIDYEIDVPGTSSVYGVGKQGAYIYLVGADDSREVFVYEGGQAGWAVPEVVGSFDISGNEFSRAVAIDGTVAYIGTDNLLASFDVSDPTAPVLLDTIIFGFAVNDIGISGDYAFLATADNASELIAVDVSDPANLLQAGTYDANTNSDGLSVWVDGTDVYLGTQRSNGTTNHEFYILGAVTGPVTTFSLLGSFDVRDNVNDIEIDGTDAFLATAQNNFELIIFDVSDPANITIQDGYNRDGTQDAFGLDYYNNRLVLVSVNPGGEEIFSFDVTDRTNIILEATLETGHNLYSVAVDQDYVYAVGDENTQEFLLVDLSSAGSGVLFEVADVDMGGACDAVVFDGSYAYAGCSTQDAELQIVGPATGPTNYTREGWFTSSSFDSGSVTTTWQDINWLMSGTGEVGIQLRTAPDAGGTPGVWTPWYGPSGFDSYYTEAFGGNALFGVHQDGSGDQWLQFRARLLGDTVSTPILESVTLEY